MKIHDVEAEFTTLTNRINALENEKNKLKAKLAALESKNFEISIPKVMESYNTYPSGDNITSKYIEYITFNSVVFQLWFLNKSYPNALYFFMLFDNLNGQTATIEFDFKKNTESIKCDTVGLNATITSAVEQNQLTPNASYQLDGEINGIDLEFDESCKVYVKQFFMIENNCSDETSSTIAGMIKMLK